jgi:purine-nucleoside phosphorylase
MEDVVTIPYREIPSFPVSTVQGHRGNLVLGFIRGKPTMVLQGRFHRYEGYSFGEIGFPIWVMKTVGVSLLVVCSAAGGLDPRFSSGDIMIITDHINLMDGNPLAGSNIDSLGPRFPSMNEPYSHELIRVAREAAADAGIAVREGVYVAVTGPSLETPAETRFLRGIGADAVGMSTVPEVIVGIHAGMKILGLSVISNVNVPENLQPFTVEDVIEVARRAGPRLLRIVTGVIDRV